MVVSPLFTPFLGLKTDRERASHLYCSANREERSGDVVEEPEYFVVEVNGGAAELNPGQAIVLFHVNRFYLLFEFLYYSFLVSKWKIELLSLISLRIFEFFDKKIIKLTYSFSSLQGIKEPVYVNR